MESEKVKEIKKALECCQGETPNCADCSYWCSCKKDYGVKFRSEILTLINELESENERLLESCKNCHYIKDLEIANGHTKELKDRIALLEKDNETLRNAKVVYESVDYCYEDLKKAEKRIAELEKENEIKTDTITDLLKKQEVYEVKNKFVKEQRLK